MYMFGYRNKNKDKTQPTETQYLLKPVTGFWNFRSLNKQRKKNQTKVFILDSPADYQMTMQEEVTVD